MQTSIHILPDDLINQIAAGEVIERPASVVKELIENSIDALATKITVEVQGSGKKLIRVSDNAGGMDKEELKLCCLRHATSKINTSEDLFNIHTLGFRGEALASIAAVSKLEVRSKVPTSKNGHVLKIEAGNIINFEDYGCPDGTTVMVKDLFFNTPARKKFLKADYTELGHIGDIVSKSALAFPEISFEFISDGKTLLQTPGTGILRDAILSIYGLDLAKGLIAHEATFGFGKVFGFLSQPTFTRVDKTYETFFVNQRYIKNFLLNRALEDGYRTLIPNNRYPIAIIFIGIDPALVDVNVHPAKREVKFLKTNEVMEAIRTFVKQALENTKPAMDLREIPCGSLSWQNKNDLESSTEILFNATLEPYENPFFSNYEPSAQAGPQPIFQFKNTYILAVDQDELIFIDQHAAHERVIYDQLSQTTKTQGQQTALIPETIELNVQEIALLQENLKYLGDLGFDLEEFGANTYKISSVPTISAKTSAKQMIQDILGELRALGNSAALGIKQENIRKMVACKSAIKAGDKLTFEEMNNLIKQLQATANPQTCPHGRPTIFKLSQADLAKKFLR